MAKALSLKEPLPFEVLFLSCQKVPHAPPTLSTHELHVPPHVSTVCLTLRSSWCACTCTSHRWSSFNQTLYGLAKNHENNLNFWVVFGTIFWSIFCLVSTGFLEVYGMFHKPNLPPWNSYTNYHISLLQGSSKQCFLGSRKHYIFLPNNQFDRLRSTTYIFTSVAFQSHLQRTR